jgi:hypothetical protein
MATPSMVKFPRILVAVYIHSAARDHVGVLDHHPLFLSGRLAGRFWERFTSFRIQSAIET